MREDTPEAEPEKPRYLLPDGCKDLIDAIRLQQEEDADPETTFGEDTLPESLPTSIKLAETIIIGDLARSLHIPFFRILSLLMKHGIFKSKNSEIDFNTASLICREYGVIPIKFP